MIRKSSSNTDATSSFNTDLSTFLLLSINFARPIPPTALAVVVSFSYHRKQRILGSIECIFVLEMKEKKKSYGLIMQDLLLWYQVDIKSKKGFCLEWKYLFLLCFLFYCLMIPLKTFDLWDPLCFIAFCKNGNIWLTWFLTCLVAIYTLSSRDYMEKEIPYCSSKVIFIFSDQNAL